MIQIEPIRIREFRSIRELEIAPNRESCVVGAERIGQERPAGRHTEVAEEVDGPGRGDEAEDEHLGAAAGQSSGKRPQIPASRRAHRERAAVRSGESGRWEAGRTISGAPDTWGIPAS